MHRKGAQKGQEKQPCAGPAPDYATTIHRLSTDASTARGADERSSHVADLRHNLFYVAAHLKNFNGCARAANAGAIGTGQADGQNVRQIVSDNAS